MATRTQEHIREDGSGPDRILAQRMAALNKADEVRNYRARLKRDIKAGRASIYDILREPSEMIETMKLFDLMMAMPRYGQVKINKILRDCNISPSREIGKLTERQRTELASMMRR